MQHRISSCAPGCVLWSPPLASYILVLRRSAVQIIIRHPIFLFLLEFIVSYIAAHKAAMALPFTWHLGLTMLICQISWLTFYSSNVDVYNTVLGASVSSCSVNIYIFSSFVFVLLITTYVNRVCCPVCKLAVPSVGYSFCCSLPC